MLYGTSQDVGRKTCPADHDVAYEANEPTWSHLCIMPCPSAA
jgi:hypothetical protein